MRDRGVGDAHVASVTYALNAGQHVAFTAAYLAAGSFGSFVLSTLLRGRLFALVFATVLLAYPLLVVSVATVKVVKSPPRVDEEGNTADRYPR